MSDLIRREDALAEVLAYLCSAPAHDEELLRWDMEQLIRALPAVQPGHVNETLKSEHDDANMLTPATKGGEG